MIPPGKDLERLKLYYAALFAVGIIAMVTLHPVMLAIFMVMVVVMIVWVGVVQWRHEREKKRKTAEEIAAAFRQAAIEAAEDEAQKNK